MSVEGDLGKAVDRKFEVKAGYTGNATGQGEQDTDLVDCVAWGGVQVRTSFVVARTVRIRDVYLIARVKASE